MLNVLNIADTSTEFMEPDKRVRNKGEIQTFFFKWGKEKAETFWKQWANSGNAHFQ